MQAISLSLLKVRKVTTLVTAAIGILLFLGRFYDYAVHDYREFITSYAYSFGWSDQGVWPVYLASAIRFTFRLSYVVSFIGLLFFQRWSVYLCLIAWLGQLLPSAIFALLSGYGIGEGHISSLILLLGYLGVMVFCWPVLKAGRSFIFCSGALASALLIHTAAFLLLFNNAALSGGHNGRYSEDPEKQEALLKAVQEKDIQTIKSFLDDKDFRPAFRGQNCDQNTICNLISYAAQNGSLDIVKALHEAGSPIDEQDGGSGDTPIIRALLSGNIGVAEYLAESGADPFKTNRFGIPAFIVASGEGSPHLLELMIKAGAPVNFRQIMPDMVNGVHGKVVGGVTPLMIAAASARLDLAQTLLNHGADASLKDEAGYDVFAYAKISNDAAIETRLMEMIKEADNKD